MHASYIMMPVSLHGDIWLIIVIMMSTSANVNPMLQECNSHKMDNFMTLTRYEFQEHDMHGL